MRLTKIEEEQFEVMEQVAERATELREVLLKRALRWFAARERGDGKAIAAVDDQDPQLAARLRAFERELALPPSPIEKARTYRRVHDALLVLRLNELLVQAEDCGCPLCAAERGESH